MAAKKGTKGASNRPRPPSNSGPQFSNWTIFGAGFFAGIFVCILMWQAVLQPEQQKAIAAAKPKPAAAKPEPKADTSATKFDFFTLLPEREVIVPDREVDRSTAQETSRSGTTTADSGNRASTNTNKPKEYFILQAGSFRNDKDADRRRAQILLLGLEAQIERVEANGDTWNRVYVGPFPTSGKASNAKAKLIGEKIDTLLLRRKAG